MCECLFVHLVMPTNIYTVRLFAVKLKSFVVCAFSSGNYKRAVTVSNQIAHINKYLHTRRQLFLHYLYTYTYMLHLIYAEINFLHVFIMHIPHLNINLISMQIN